MTLNVSAEMTAKLASVGDAPLLDSVWVSAGHDAAGHTVNGEKTQGARGTYLSSPVDGWLLHGPFDAVLG